MSFPSRIEPRQDNKEQNPPCGGSWLRDEDGGLTPADEATAAVWHAAFGHVPDPEPEPGPDLHVRFQLNAGGAAGSGQFLDERGNYIVTTESPAAAVSYVSDVKFAGENSISNGGGWLNISPSSIFDFSELDAATVETYWYRNPTTQYSIVFESRTTGGGMGGFVLYFDNAGYVHLVCREYDVFAPTLIQSGIDAAWHHVAVVFKRVNSSNADSYQATLYFDGDPVATGVVTGAQGISGSNVARIGCDLYGNQCLDRIGGVRVSEVAVYDGPFTPTFQPFPSLPTLG